MNMRFENKVAVVTGAAQGIGEAYARALAAEGHFASGSTDPNLPPMGLRVRLKASVNISGYPQEIRVILQALKDYGMFLADNGSPWYISGAPDDRWDNDMLHLMDDLRGSDFEAVEESGLMIDPDSGQSR